MTELPDLIQESLAAQQEVLRAWEALDTRGYSQIKRKYGALGHALDELVSKVDEANKAILGQVYSAGAEDSDEAPAGQRVAERYYVLPESYGYQVWTASTEDEWQETLVEANTAIIDLAGGVTFYWATSGGLLTVITYPAGWYGPFRPVLLPPEDRHSELEKPKRKKLSEMSPDEHQAALQRMRERIDRAEASHAEEEAAAEPEQPTSLTYVSQQSQEQKQHLKTREQIRRDLAKGEFPPDELGVDYGGQPIAPPEKLKNVWGHDEEPPEEPKGLPVTDEEHQAELARLREEADRENWGEGGPPPVAPDWGEDAPLPKAVQINSDGIIPSKQPGNDPLPAGAQEYADRAQKFEGTTPVEDGGS